MYNRIKRRTKMIQTPLTLTPATRSVNDASFQAYLKHAGERVVPIEPSGSAKSVPLADEYPKYPQKKDNTKKHDKEKIGYEYDPRTKEYFLTIERNNQIIKSKQHPLENIPDIEIQHKSTIDVIA